MADRTAVAESVARACTASAGTVQALAEEVGVSYAALCSWSRGRRQPPPHRLRKLADVMEDRAQRLRDLAIELRTLTDDGRADDGRTDEERTETRESLRFPAQVGGVTGDPAAPRRSWAAVGSDRGSDRGHTPLSAR